MVYSNVVYIALFHFLALEKFLDFINIFNVLVRAGIDREQSKGRIAKNVIPYYDNFVGYLWFATYLVPDVSNKIYFTLQLVNKFKKNTHFASSKHSYFYP